MSAAGDQCRHVATACEPALVYKALMSANEYRNMRITGLPRRRKRSSDNVRALGIKPISRSGRRKRRS